MFLSQAASIGLGPVHAFHRGQPEITQRQLTQRATTQLCTLGPHGLIYRFQTQSGPQARQSLLQGLKLCHALAKRMAAFSIPYNYLANPTREASHKTRGSVWN